MSEERVERRLTTILATDVVDYSRLMSADETGTLTSLKAIRRELIEPKTAEHQRWRCHLWTPPLIASGFDD